MPAARQRVVRWFADHGVPGAAVELGVAAQDWTGVAAILVGADGVPELMAGTADEVLREAAERPQVQAAEPLLRAALALARGDLLAAEGAFASAPPARAEDSSARTLAVAFLQLGIARLSGRPVLDADLVARTRGLLAGPAGPAPDVALGLSVVLDALVGAVDATAGRHGSAAAALTRGADRPGAKCHPSRADCAGQLALLEAHRGNLAEATRRAEAALAIASSEVQAGAAHAHVALASVHADRGELPEAVAELALTAPASPGAPEPWLFLARQLVEARILIASGRADEALGRRRRGRPCSTAESSPPGCRAR